MNLRYNGRLQCTKNEVLKFSIKDFFSKYHQISTKLEMENFILCAVLLFRSDY